MQFNPFKNFPLKVGAFALALLLWVHVATNRTYEYQFEIPIHLVDVPEELVLTSEQPNDLRVKIKATGKQLISMAMADAQIVLSLANYERGRLEREIVSEDVLTALDRPYENFEIVIPRKVPLRLERRVEKQLPVRATNEIAAATGFAIMSQIRVEPETVLVSGPSPYMSKLKYLQTDSTSFVELDRSVEEQIALLLPDSLKLTVSDSLVTLSIIIEAKRTKFFDSVVVVPPKGFNLTKYAVIPETLSLTLEAPESLVDSLSRDDFEISFKRPAILRDSVRAALRTTLPDHVTIIAPLVDSVLIISRDESSGD